MESILTQKDPLKYPYTGTKQPEENAKDKNGYPLYGYLPDDDLVKAVNLAIHLERPLLIKGEPGSGKTRLARAVAYELDLPYEAWHVKSTSKALDGFYTYDNISRLRDAQLGRLESIDNPFNYVRLEALGRALQNDQRTVVLIDEIDKADIDFPNDLLLELDERRFLIKETGQEVLAMKPPMVFITSNDEKDLPDAFLRRCVFHYIKFPDKMRLAKILELHSPHPPKRLVEAAVERFSELRDKMYEDRGEVGKKVNTSELIDWFRVLRLYPEDESLALLESELPFADVLLKSWDDHKRYLKQPSTEILL